ncbi:MULTISPECIES: hypothetical protein [unclassified Streptomyces]|uniref:hypothetical protein n=1 Tax=unclassified Streptomyces TaxID=2593676 RepID=UPI00278BD5F5|nr:MULTISPECIES: hypothetical protein [unclassified Streptomyces]
MPSTALADKAPSTVNVSLRESRLVVGRVLRALGVPRGAVNAARDTTVVADALGLDALRLLHDDAETVRRTAAAHNHRRTEGPDTTVDARGRHALVAAPDLLDLAVALTHRHVRARVAVLDVVRPELLDVLPVRAAEFGVAVTVSEDGGRRVLECAPLREAAPADPLDHVLRHGLDVSADLWWNLFRLGNEALTPDSALSRQHTGRSVFDESGRIVGEVGEDWADQPSEPSRPSEPADPAAAPILSDGR